MYLSKKPFTLMVMSVLSSASVAQLLPTNTQAFEEVIVSASRVDTNALGHVSVSTSDTANLLRNVPGISLQSAGGVASLPVIHGMSDDRVRTKLDGMDLISSCANHMNPPLSYIAPNNVDSISVFAGITSVSVGGDSIGGTIIVNSAEPEFSTSATESLSKGKIGAFYRSNGDVVGGDLAATLASDKLSINYTVSTVSSDNHTAADNFKPSGLAASDRGYLSGDEVGSSYYESTNQALNFALKHDNHLVDLKFGYQHIPEQGFANQRMDMTDNTGHSINLNDKITFNWGTLQARLYHEKTRHSMNFGDDKQFLYGDAPGMPMETEGKTTGAIVKAEINLSASDILRTGIEYQAYQLDDWWPPSGTGMMMAPNTFQNINDGTRDRYDVFGEWETQWSKQWTSIFGVRSDTVRMNTDDVQGYSNTNGMGMMMYNYEAESTAFNARSHQRQDDNVDVTAVARYTPDLNQTYEMGFARKSRSPNLYERYTWSTSGMSMIMVNFAGDGNGYVGNLELEPEVANTLSFTADWHDAHSQQWNVAITPYLTYVDDYIDATRCSSATAACSPANQTAQNSFVYLQFVNQDARLYGVDMSGSYLLSKHKNYGSFVAKALIAYVNGENLKTHDNLYNMMPINAKLSLEQRVGKWINILEAEFVAAKDDVSAVRNEIATSGYSVFNVRSSYDWNEYRIDVGIENLADKYYELPLGGAYVGQGVTMSGNGVPYGIAVPGMGRSIYAGLSVEF